MKRGKTKLINPSTGLMECQICQKRWIANIRQDSNGDYYRGSWQCENGCNKKQSK